MIYRFRCSYIILIFFKFTYIDVEYVYYDVAFTYKFYRTSSTYVINDIYI